LSAKARAREARAFLLHRKLRFYEAKKLREDAHCAREEDVANATALGARISQARFFAHAFS